MRKDIAGSSWVYTLLLVAVTAVWGWTFVVVQDAIALYGVIPFLAGRFVLAGAALAPLYATKLTRRTLLVGGGIGVVLAAGYLFQTTVALHLNSVLHQNYKVCAKITSGCLARLSSGISAFLKLPPPNNQYVSVLGTRHENTSLLHA